MQLISPVMSGTYDNPAYVPAKVNINQSDAASGASDVDSRRYSQYDRSASQVADADMSFGDVLDMLNPLQHIPVVSSIYRYVTGDTIKPVPRIAGNILYGLAGGLVGAVVGGIGAVADSIIESQTGKDMGGTVMAELFGDDQKPANDASTQLAAGSAASQDPGTAPAAPALQLVTADIPPKADAAPAAAAAAPQNLLAAKSYPLVRNKLPYGGAMPLPDYSSENLKMSVAKATGMHIGNTVYPSLVRNGVRGLPATPPAAAASAAAAPAPRMASNVAPQPAATPPAATSDSSATMNAAASVATAAPQQAAANNDMPPNLQDDALILRALGLYRSVAQGKNGAAGN